MSNLLKNALLLDTETTGLTRGSGIHELAIYNLDAQELHEVYLRPNLVQTQGNLNQESTRLASSPQDLHKGVKRDTWKDLLLAQMQIEGRIQGEADEAELMRVLKQANPFLHRAIKDGKHPHLEGPLDPIYLRERERSLKAMNGVRRAVSSEGTVEEVLGKGGLLHKAMTTADKTQGKTLWIANAAFEAKQIGAQLGALGEEHANAIKAQLETQTKGWDPFYITGGEVNHARVQAQLSGDWTGVWKAYKKHTPKAGEVAVRDIQDVLRAMTSYAKKTGITSISDPYMGTSMDLSSRLFGSLDQDAKQAAKKLVTPEVHKAAEDLVVTEVDVLKKAAYYTDVLQEVHEDSPLGRKYQAMAREGKGPLAEISKYYARMEQLEPTLKEINLSKRLARAQEDFISQGKTYQRTGAERVAYMKQQTPSGPDATVARLVSSRGQFNNWDSLTSWLKQEGRYDGLDIDAAVEDMRTAVGTGGAEERRANLGSWLEKKTDGILQAKIEASKDVLMTAENRHLGKLVSRWSSPARAIGYAADAASQMKPSGKLALGAAAGLAGLGFVASAGGMSQERPEPKSLVAYNYQEWAARQEARERDAAFDSQGQSFYNLRSPDQQLQGMGHDGLAGFWRSVNTDFGSPYIGMSGSQIVFHDQELIREREKWIRSEYMRRHYDKQDGLFGVFGPFQAARRKGYNLMGSGEAVSQGIYTGLQNTHKLLELDLSDGKWAVSAEDVDTIVVKRGGVRGAMQSFFGLNKRYSFRLEGIDSTEVTHGPFSSDGGQYHAPQPFAEESTAAMQQMLANKKMKIIYNPTDSTYGRQLAVLYADGKNMNVEAVKRGYAAFLPYNKREEAIVNWEMLEQAQAGAMASGRGLWSQPWAQVYGEFYKAGHNSITFNTFTRKEKIVKNRTTMDLLSMMEHAQSQGFMSTQEAMGAQQLASNFNMYGDKSKVRPIFFDQPKAHYNAYMGEMMRNLGTWNRTNGTGNAQNRFSRKGNYGKLDQSLAQDTMGYTDNVWTKRKLRNAERYPMRKDRIEQRRRHQASMQRTANQHVFDSPTNHHVM